MRIAVVTAALLGASAYAASSAWVEDWAANRALIDASVKGVPDLEASASAFEAEIDAAIANGTSDTELTRLLMDFLVELDDDPRFGGFAATNESSASASGSVSAGSASAAGSSTGSSSSGASAVNAASVVTVTVAVVATVAMTLA